ncbi:MAG: UbiA family prenyltransferase [Pseudomonadota bacterium]
MPEAVGTGDRPLVVDLDGTLIAGDMFLEQCLLALKGGPAAWGGMAGAFTSGIASAKAWCADHTRIDPATLPFRAEVLDWLRGEHARGRRLILATAADRKVADAVATHLGLFDLVLASEDGRNLKGRAKAEAIRETLGDAAFDYLGDSTADRAVWSSAGRAHVVARGAADAQRLSDGVDVAHWIARPGAGAGTLLRAMRVHQWAKNALLFAPLFLSHSYTDPVAWSLALTAFLAMGLCASGTYFVNDLLDLANDRVHPTKRHRPLAAGLIAPREGIVWASGLIGAGLLIGLAAGGVAVFAALIAYIAITLSYSLYLKRVAIADVMLLALLYLFRIVLGSVATAIAISDWLAAFSIFFFTSLGFLKRLSDLPIETASSSDLRAGRGYAGRDAPLLTMLGVGAGYCSVIIMALYINDPEVLSLYARPELLWAVCFVILFWLSRLWLLAHRREVPDDPVIFAVRDPISHGCGVLCLVLIVLASRMVG